MHVYKSRSIKAFQGATESNSNIISSKPSPIFCPYHQTKATHTSPLPSLLSLGLLAESRCDHCIAKRNRSPSPKQKGAGKKALALSKCGIASSKRLERRNQESSVCNELEWFLRFTSDTVNHDPDLSSLLYGIHSSFRSNFD